MERVGWSPAGRRLLVVLAALVALAAALPVAHLQQLQGSKVEWIVSFSPQEVYIGQPAVLKVYSYNPQAQVIYNVSCNVTVTNSTDVVEFLRGSGIPAVVDVSLRWNGTYEVQAFCNDSAGYSIERTFELTVMYPTPEVSYTAYWMLPANVTLRTPYPYNGTNVTVRYGNVTETVALEDGEASLGLGPILAPERLYVTLFGYTLSYEVVPEPPEVLVEAPPEIQSGENYTFYVGLESDGVTLDVSYPVVVAVSGCYSNATQPSYTYEPYSLYAAPTLRPGLCLITAEASPWPNETVRGEALVAVQPVSVAPTFEYYNETPYSYVFVAGASVSPPLNSSVILYVNGAAVARTPMEVSGSVGLAKGLTFQPGTYVVTAVLETPYFNYTIGSATIVVPRYRLNVTVPPVVYAGQQFKFPEGVEYYEYYLGGGEYAYVIYFPGNSTYGPLDETVVVRYLFPSVEIASGQVTVTNGAPGANLTVYCANNGTEVLQAYLSSSNETFSLSNMLSCSAYYAYYRYGTFFEAFYERPGAYVAATTYAMAGVPTVVVPAYSGVEYATIGDEYYEPGTNVTLPAGTYTVTVYFENGTTVSFQLVVVAPNISVYAFPAPGGWGLDVVAPPGVEVYVAFADGLVEAFGPGEYFTSVEPVGAYWPYGPVRFYNVTVIPP